MADGKIQTTDPKNLPPWWDDFWKSIHNFFADREHPSMRFEWECLLEKEIAAWHVAQLEKEIAAWHVAQLEMGEIVPDFWDDLSTSERLAIHLISAGWRKQ